MAWEKAGHWTYTGNPSDSDKDAVRFLIGDTDEADPLVSDEEITFAVTDTGSVKGGAVQVLETLAARYARDASTSVSAGGGMSTSVTKDKRTEAFAARAKEIRATMSRTLGGMIAGGISIADKLVQTDNDDNLVAYFDREMDVNA